MFKDKKEVCMRTEIPFYPAPKNSANQFGLDTSIKVYFSSEAHNTTMAINTIKAVAKK